MKNTMAVLLMLLAAPTFGGGKPEGVVLCVHGDCRPFGRLAEVNGTEWRPVAVQNCRATIAGECQAKKNHNKKWCEERKDKTNWCPVFGCFPTARYCDTTLVQVRDGGIVGTWRVETSTEAWDAEFAAATVRYDGPKP